MKIYLTRHAETVANQKGIILGWLDSPPTESGLLKSKELAVCLSYGETGIIVSSPQRRAVATAEMFAFASGWRITTTNNLMELGCGEWEGCERLSVLREGRPLRPTWTDSPPGGESCAAAEARVAEAIRGIGTLPYEEILVVGHAGINQVFLKVWLRLDPQDALSISHPHDLLYKIDNHDVSWLNGNGMMGKGVLIQG